MYSNTLSRLALITLTSTIMILTGCGGGDSSTDDTTTGSTPAQIQGFWTTACGTETDGTSSADFFDFGDLSDGSGAFVALTATYATSNCTGTATTLAIGGPIEYNGTSITSICTAEKINGTVILITDGDTDITGAALQQFLLDNGTQAEVFDIACQFNNQLLLGLNTLTLTGTSDATRPVEMDTSRPFTFIQDSLASKGIGKSKTVKEFMQRAVSRY